MGVIKPDIVFYGESLTADFFHTLADDLPRCDLLIVIGSTLKVDPVARIVRQVSPEVPQLLINRELVAQPHQFDAQLLGKCDNAVAALWKGLDPEDYSAKLRTQKEGFIRREKKKGHGFVVVRDEGAFSFPCSPPVWVCPPSTLSSLGCRFLMCR